MCQSTSVYRNMTMKTFCGNTGSKFLIAVYPDSGKWQLIICWILYFGQGLLFQNSPY